MKHILIPITILALSIHSYAQQQQTSSVSPVTAEGKKKEAAPLNEKEISTETTWENGLDLLLENERRTVEIKSWDKPKVKITTNIVYTGESTLTDEAWFEKLNISWKKFGGSFRISSKGINDFSGSGEGTFAVFDGNGRASRQISNKKRIVTIYIPQHIKVEAETTGGELNFSGKLETLKLVSSNAAISTGEVDRLILRSQHDNISILNVKDAEVELNNSRFSIKAAGIIDIDSKYANIEMLSVDKATIRSNNDEYDIDNAGIIRGRKNYGTLRIATLVNSIELEGANADIKIRRFDSEATLVKLDNKYADIRLPANDIKNYSVKMEGSYNNVYASFEKVPTPTSDTTIATISKVNGRGRASAAPAPTPPTPPTPPAPATVDTAGNYHVHVEIERENSVTIKETVKRALKAANDNVYVTGYSNSRRNSNSSNFTAKVGNGSGLKFDLHCSYCTVDFK